MIEIKGTGFVNKGAELMLHAIIEEVSHQYPDASYTLAPGFLSAPYEKYSSLGLFPKASIWYKGFEWMSGAVLIPEKIRKMYGLIIDEEVDLVLDASGFAYSDLGGICLSQMMAKACKKWKKQGTKVILLPQAFGPFSSPKIKRAIRTIVDNADLIYAREKVSYAHLISVVGQRHNIKIAPDFTNLLSGKMPKGYDLSNKEICIVPNYRMIDKTSREISQAYRPFLILS